MLLSALQAVNNQAQIASAAFAFQDDREAVQRCLDGELGLRSGLLVGDGRYVGVGIDHKSLREIVVSSDGVDSSGVAI